MTDNKVLDPFIGKKSKKEVEEAVENLPQNIKSPGYDKVQKIINKDKKK